MTTKVKYKSPGGVVGVVRVSDNNVTTINFEDEELESLVSRLDGATGYDSDSPTDQDTDHIDVIRPMREQMLVKNVKAIAGANSLDVIVS